MKQSIVKIALFLAPLLVIVGLLPVDRRYAFKELKDDCLSKGIWLFDRIHRNDKPIHTLFMGSSHTINAIDDPYIDSALGSNLGVVNFGYCRLGRNLQWTLLNEVIQKKSPKHLILEIRQEENPSSHPVFPFMSTTSQMLGSVFQMNPNYFSDLWKHGSYRLELYQDRLFNRGDSLHIFPWDHGLKVAPDTAKPNSLDLRNKSGGGRTPLSSESAYVTLSKIHQLCKREGIQLTFLYLPNYADMPLPVNNQERYLQWGEIWHPPTALLLDKNLWFDTEHLNTAGCRKLSEWLVQQIKASKAD